jgi:hypothetical protein
VFFAPLRDHFPLVGTQRRARKSWLFAKRRVFPHIPRAGCWSNAGAEGGRGARCSFKIHTMEFAPFCFTGKSVKSPAG